jgi:C1A family cysteine protease
MNYTYVNDFDFYSNTNATVVKRLLQNYGPVASYIQHSADYFVLKSYTGGVITANCPSENPRHGVLIVGYGWYRGYEYFLVRSSHGTSYGLEGYLKISTSSANICGIMSTVVYATSCSAFSPY